MNITRIVLEEFDLGRGQFPSMTVFTTTGRSDTQDQLLGEVSDAYETVMKERLPTDDKEMLGYTGTMLVLDFCYPQSSFEERAQNLKAIALNLKNQYPTATFEHSF